jgi:hypothetical protein
VTTGREHDLTGTRIAAEPFGGDPASVAGVIVRQYTRDDDPRDDVVWFTVRDDQGAEFEIRSDEVVSS